VTSNKFSWDLQIFIKNYSKIVTPSTQFTQARTIFNWDEKFVKVFKLLKSAFTIAPILIHEYPSKPIFLEINAPNFIFHVMLFLYGSDYIMLDWIQGNFQWLK
jgi:hypothetical protein